MSAPKIARNQVLVGDARSVIEQLPSDSFDMVLTSPPYFRLRDYGIVGQTGLEAHVDQWVNELHLAMTALRRVLKPTSTLWLNLGDSYSTHLSQGAPRKSLLLGPERLATRLVADGWILRNKTVWAKTNPTPTSVKDRLNTTHEYLYVFAREPRYHFDLDAVRVPHTSTVRARPTKHSPAAERAREAWRGPNGDDASGLRVLHARGLVGHPKGKNPGDVWQIASSSFRGAHHATFPVELARRAIQAGCPPSGLVLDPYMGAGTTAVAAERLGRDWLGIELNPEFAALARERIAAERERRTGRAA